MTALRGVALTIAATVLAGAAAWFVTSPDVSEPVPVGDRVRAAAEALRTAHVYVEPESADLLGAEDLARLDAAAAAAKPETFVVVWEDSTNAGYYLPRDGLRQLGAELGRPGYYVSVGRGGVSSIDIGIDGEYASADDFEEGEVIDQQSVAARITDILAESDGREFSAASTSGSDYWGGPWGTLAAGLMFGVFGGLLLALVAVPLWFFIRSRLRSPS